MKQAAIVIMLWAVLHTITLLLRFFGVVVTQRTLFCAARCFRICFLPFRRRDTATEFVIAELYFRLIETAAARTILSSTCLAKAITLQAVLVSFGLDSDICIGVAKPCGNALSAHAWVELNGKPVGEDTTETTKRFSTIKRLHAAN